MSYEVCAAPKGIVLRRFGLKMGLDFAHFAVESGIVFEKTKGKYERIQEPITWHIIRN